MGDFSSGSIHKPRHPYLNKKGDFQPIVMSSDASTVYRYYYCKEVMFSLEFVGLPVHLVGEHAFSKTTALKNLKCWQKIRFFPKTPYFSLFNLFRH